MGGLRWRRCPRRRTRQQRSMAELIWQQTQFRPSLPTMRSRVLRVDDTFAERRAVNRETRDELSVFGAGLSAIIVYPLDPVCEGGTVSRAAALPISRRAVAARTARARGLRGSCCLRCCRAGACVVPRGARAEHLEHHPGVGIVLGLHEMHEHTARLIQGVRRIDCSCASASASRSSRGLMVTTRNRGSRCPGRSLCIPSTLRLQYVIARQWAPRLNSAGYR